MKQPNNFIKIIWRKIRITSSRHGPYELGYTCATKAITKRYENANWSES